MENIKYYHYHLGNRHLTLGRIFNPEDGSSRLAYALCSSKDKFSRAKGREIVTARLEKNSSKNFVVSIDGPPNKYNLLAEFGNEVSSWPGNHPYINKDLLALDNFIYKWLKKANEEESIYSENYYHFYNKFKKDYNIQEALQIKF